MVIIFFIPCNLVIFFIYVFLLWQCILSYPCSVNTRKVLQNHVTVAVWSHDHYDQEVATCAAVKIALFPPGYQLQLLQLVILQTPHSVTATQPYTTGVTRHGGGHGLLILSVIFDMRPTALLNFVAKSCLEFAAPPSNYVCHTYLCLKAPVGALYTTIRPQP